MVKNEAKSDLFQIMPPSQKAHHFYGIRFPTWLFSERCLSQRDLDLLYNLKSPGFTALVF